MATMTYPPGPKKTFIVGNLPAFKKDRLGLLLNSAREFGDLVYLRFGPLKFYSVSHPDLVQQVLVTQADKFQKAPIYKRLLSRFLGDGLLISDGDYWKRQRMMMQPAFHTKRINTYAETMTQYTRQMLESWSDGQTRDLHQDMMHLTLNITAKTLFGSDVSADAARIGESMDVMVRVVIDESSAPIKFPAWFPTPGHRLGWQANHLADQVVLRIIDERRQSGEDRGDLLSMLLLAQDEDGTKMTDKQVRDEALTLLVAGHETTANALAWTWYLLAQHPEIEAKLYAEVAQVLGGRAPTLADAANLTYTEMALKESMRFYPPVWSFSRQALEPAQIGGYLVEKDTAVMIATWVLHRDPRFWDQPEQFCPEHFTPENEAARPKLAYLPFGGGRRICIGNAFAMLEAKLVVATIMQQYRLERATDTPIEPEALITLRPAGGMPLKLVRRSG